MRTSLADILRLALALYRHPYREHLRIGQILVNACLDENRVFYMENAALIRLVVDASLRR